MNFEITNIIDKEDLKIKILSYLETPHESLDLTILASDELEKFIGFYSTKRKLEFYYTRLLWRSFGEDETIRYSVNGKPLIVSGHISISHSKNKIAIAYSKNHNIGLDIEHFNEKIFRIQPKFTCSYENEHFDLTDHEIITTIWSIKEAVYKLVEVPGLRFKEDICVLEIANSNRVEVELSVSKKHLMFERINFDTFILTYCITE